MEHNRNAAAANAHAAAASAKQAATSARLAEIDAKYARSGDLAGFLREVGAAGLTLADLADWLAAAGAADIPKFAVGDMLAKEHPGKPSCRPCSTLGLRFLPWLANFCTRCARRGNSAKSRPTGSPNSTSKSPGCYSVGTELHPRGVAMTEALQASAHDARSSESRLGEAGCGSGGPVRTEMCVTTSPCSKRMS